MEKPEMIWHYKAKQISKSFTSENYCIEYPIYVVTREKNEYWEIIRAIYQYMRKLYQKNHPYYNKRIRVILNHAEQPFNLIADFENERNIIWSNDSTVQENSKKLFKDWQQLKDYYNDLIAYCNQRKNDIAAAIEILDNKRYSELKIDYKPPNMRWIMYDSGLKIKENYITYDGKSYQCSEFVAEGDAEKQFYNDLFNVLYKYLYSELPEKGCKPELQFTFDYLDQYNKLILQIRKENDFDYSFFWKNAIVLWSNNPMDQEDTKRTFPEWKYIKQYYDLYVDRWKNRSDICLIDNFIQSQIVKTERKNKREQNDPTNQVARQRKARRHLQRLGYDLHKSRKFAKTKNDYGLYQIVKLDSDEIVAGKLFDLTLNQVEQFYMDEDYSRRVLCRTDAMGYLYNMEPNLEERKKKIQKSLRKKGYILEIGFNEYGYGEHYNSSCYRIKLEKSKRKVKFYTEGDNKYLYNGEKKTFTLNEVETFILSNS